MTILDSLEAAEKAATARPWRANAEDVPPNWVTVYADDRELFSSSGGLVDQEVADAVLIAILRNHAANLVAVARAAQEWQRIFDADYKTDVEWANGMQRLRHALALLTTEGSDERPNPILIWKARAEALEAALREIADYSPERSARRAEDMARRALEKA